MKLTLMKGSFDAQDALEMITKMIAIKIKYHEDRISKQDTEEDVKMRETRIRQLQKELYEARQLIENQPDPITIHADIYITPQRAAVAASLHPH